MRTVAAKQLAIERCFISAYRPFDTVEEVDEDECEDVCSTPFTVKIGPPGWIETAAGERAIFEIAVACATFDLAIGERATPEFSTFGLTNGLCELDCEFAPCPEPFCTGATRANRAVIPSF